MSRVPSGLGCNVGRALPLLRRRVTAAPRWALATRVCRRCDGSGEVTQCDPGMSKMTARDVPCPVCEGDGTVRQVPHTDPLFRLAYHRRQRIRAKGYPGPFRHYDEERRVAFHPVQLPGGAL